MEQAAVEPVSARLAPFNHVDWEYAYAFGCRLGHREAAHRKVHPLPYYRAVRKPQIERGHVERADEVGAEVPIARHMDCAVPRQFPETEHLAASNPHGERMVAQFDAPAFGTLERGNRLVKGQVFLWEGARSWHDLWDEDGVIVDCSDC